MNKNIIWIAAVVIVVAGLAYYMISNQSSYTAPQAQNNANTVTPTPTSAPGALALNIETDATLGKYLVAANGMTLYVFASDKVGVSNCTDTCAANWPPYTVKDPGTALASAGITGNIGTINRADGTIQVTYNGRPLYFWKSDLKPGDITGNGVGGVWSVAKP
ncbi:MAG: hypothetical protein ABSF47_03530 [Minisyncoccia bacterium]|jgi:predicted lipoprotein with Yx(FWY)xxD motif